MHRYTAIRFSTRNFSTQSSRPLWGLNERYAAALQPQLVAALDRAVLQGILNRPTWQRDEASALQRTYCDFLTTPRDAYVFDASLKMTLGDVIDDRKSAFETSADTSITSLSSKLGLDPLLIAKVKKSLQLPAPVDDNNAQNVALLNSQHTHAFLESCEHVFEQLFGQGFSSWSTEQQELAQELLHERIHSQLASSSSNSNASGAVHVLTSRIVDFHALWDGTTSADDLKGNYAARELGHTIALETKQYSGILTRMLSTAAHFYQLHPARSLVSRVTVAFLCLETSSSGELMGAPLPSWLLNNSDTPGRKRRRANAKSAATTDETVASVEETTDGGGAHNSMNLLVSRLSASLPVGILRVAPRFVRALGPDVDVMYSTPHDTTPIPGLKATVHTVTFEAQGKGPEYPFKPLRYLLPSSIKCTQGWKIVDVDGRFVEEGLSCSSNWAPACKKAADRVKREMESLVERTLPGGSDTIVAVRKVGKHFERIGSLMEHAKVPVDQHWKDMRELIEFARMYAEQMGTQASEMPWKRRLDRERQLEEEAASATTTTTTAAEGSAPELFTSGSCVIRSSIVLEPRPDMAKLFALLDSVEKAYSAIPLAIHVQLKIVHRAFVSFNELVQMCFIVEMISHVVIPSLIASIVAGVQGAEPANAELLEEAVALQTRAKDARLFQIALTASFEGSDVSNTSGEASSAQIREEFYTDLIRFLEKYTGAEST